MKPFLEHIAASKDGSWTLFDRRLPAIPFEWHYNSEYELTLTLNSRGQRFIGDNMAPYGDGDLVLIGPKIPHTWCSTGDCGAGPTHQALVLWFSESFVQSLIRSHVELRPIQVLLERSTRAIEFSDEVKTRARPIIRAMLDQTAEDRLPILLQLLLLLSRDLKANPSPLPPSSPGRTQPRSASAASSPISTRTTGRKTQWTSSAASPRSAAVHCTASSAGRPA